MKVNSTETETEDGGKRCWLSDKEQEQLLNYYDEEPRKQLAIRLMMRSGLRVKEALEVCKSDLREADGADFIKLRVEDTKNEDRTTIVTDKTAQQLRTVSNLTGRDEVFDSSKRTLQNWVFRAAEDLYVETENEDWREVSAHDLRRTWATDLLHRGIPSEVVMRWGGWQNHETFEKHYYEQSDEQIQEHLDKIGF